MLQTLIPAALGTGFIYLMTALGAAAVFFLPKSRNPALQKLINGVCAGVMTAASVWSLLLPAIARSSALGLPCWLPPAVGLSAGGLLLGALDEAIRRLPPQTLGRGGLSRENVLLFVAITLHNIPEGMAVGLAFALAASGEGLAAAGVLTLGIGIQNFPEGAAISLPLRQSGLSRARSFALGALSGVVEPLFGLLVVFAAAGFHALMPWLLGFAAGAMLYVVAEEMIPQAHSKAGTAGYLAGFLLMMILDVALG